VQIFNISWPNFENLKISLGVFSNLFGHIFKDCNFENFWGIFSKFLGTFLIFLSTFSKFLEDLQIFLGTCQNIWEKFGKFLETFHNFQILQISLSTF
jgi:hypothetical protein